MTCASCDQPLPVGEAVYVGSDPCHPACADAWWNAVAATCGGPSVTADADGLAWCAGHGGAG